MLGISAIWLLGPADASAIVSCSYSAANPEAATGNVVSIQGSQGSYNLPALKRSGNTIEIVDAVLQQPVSCAGGTPTLTNTDTIALSSGTHTALTLDMREGAFEPGATDEGDGFSEIEFDLDWQGGFLNIIGDLGGQRLSFAKVGSVSGLNFNPGLEPAEVDADLGEVAGVIVRGWAGTDVWDASGRFGFGKPFRRPVQFDARGSFDGLYGGSADDLLEGGAGNDRIDGGRGNDTIKGGGRDDNITARDGDRDQIRCGSGKDRVEADLRDVVIACEVATGGASD